MGNNIALTIEEDVVYKAKFDTTPFAYGVSRVAFKGKIVAPKSKAGILVVVKKFRREHGAHKKDWNIDLQISERAQELAQEFNETTNTNRPITFKQPLPMVITDTPVFRSSAVREGEWVIAEKFIEGKYTKWNSNAGYVNYREMGEGGSIPAFSHWTWVKTGGELIVCDLQGVRNDNPTEYRLTDPAINSRTQKYGKTDLGMFGISAFFQYHRCTKFCRALGLVGKVPSSETDPLNILLAMLFSEKSSTSYDNQVQSGRGLRFIANRFVPVLEESNEDEEDDADREESSGEESNEDEEDDNAHREESSGEESNEDEEEDDQQADQEESDDQENYKDEDTSSGSETDIDDDDINIHQSDSFVKDSDNEQLDDSNQEEGRQGAIGIDHYYPHFNIDQEFKYGETELEVSSSDKEFGSFL